MIRTHDPIRLCDLCDISIRLTAAAIDLDISFL
jgi:hypothetical protein